MNKINLETAIVYSSKRGGSQELYVDNYITTDNLLQNKAGVTLATNLPPNGNYFSKYEEGDVLISNIRPYLKKIWYANREGLCSSDILVLTSKIKFHSKFIYYNLHQDAFFNHMMNGAKGTKMPRGDKGQILKFQIPDLPFPTQQKIAAVLSALDDKIELNNKINAELEAMAKTLYDYWFVQFDFPDANGKPYKSSGGKMVYNEVLKREIPEDWEVKSLREFADTGSGGTPLSTNKEYYENGNIPWINSGELNQPFIVNAQKFITEKGLNNSSAKLFKKGTILMAMYGATAGKVGFMDFEACTNQAICAIVPNNYHYNEYIKFGLEDLYKYLINLSSGSARDNLSQEKIRELKFVFPIKEIIKSFHNKSNPMLLKILMNLKENQNLSTLRDWLLPMLMNGQVNVGKAYEEVEEVLSVAAEDGAAYRNQNELNR